MMSYLSIGTISLLLTKPRLEKSRTEKPVGGKEREASKELQGKTRRKEQNIPSGDREKEKQGKNHSSKGTFSPLFLSNATAVLVTAIKNLHHPTPALSLRKLTTNFTEIPAGLSRVRGTGSKFEALIWKLNLALSEQAQWGKDTYLERSEEAQPLPSTPLCPLLGTLAQFTGALQHNLTEDPCLAT